MQVAVDELSKIILYTVWLVDLESVSVIIKSLIFVSSVKMVRLRASIVFSICFLSLLVFVSSDYTCSKTKQCESGCCRLEPDGWADSLYELWSIVLTHLRTGNCGLGRSICWQYDHWPNEYTGPEFCGPGNCTSTCDQKAECDPGWGMEWSLNKSCPLNVCCSKFGYCGMSDVSSFPYYRLSNGEQARHPTFAVIKQWPHRPATAQAQINELSDTTRAGILMAECAIVCKFRVQE